jgi:hypothetical protein
VVDKLAQSFKVKKKEVSFLLKSIHWDETDRKSSVYLNVGSRFQAVLIEFPGFDHRGADHARKQDLPGGETRVSRMPCRVSVAHI